MACNCAWGCPCSFESPPTHGTCEAADANRITEGKYGDVSLNGLKWAFVAKWPGPLHKGGGTGVVFIEPDVKGARREALEAIATGRAGSPWGIIMSTVTAGLKVETVPIEFKFAGKNSYFRAGNNVVEFAAMRNPVTKEEHFATLKLPTGLLTSSEDFFTTRTFNVSAGEIRLRYPGHNALAFKTTWKGP
jgi:hypothetical protein